MQDKNVRVAPAARIRRLLRIIVGAVLLFGLAHFLFPASLSYLLTAVMAGLVFAVATVRRLSHRPESWATASLTSITVLICFQFMLGRPFFYPLTIGWQTFLLVLIQWLVVWGLTFLGAGIGLGKWQKLRAERTGRGTS